MPEFCTTSVNAKAKNPERSRQFSPLHPTINTQVRMSRASTRTQKCNGMRRRDSCTKYQSRARFRMTFGVAGLCGEHRQQFNSHFKTSGAQRTKAIDVLIAQNSATFFSGCQSLGSNSISQQITAQEPISFSEKAGI